MSKEEPKPELQPWAERLDWAIARSEKTLVQIEKETGISTGNLSKMRQAKRGPPKRMQATKLAVSLDVEQRWLFDGEGPVVGDLVAAGRRIEGRLQSSDELEIAIRESRLWAPTTMAMPDRDRVAKLARAERAQSTSRFSVEDWRDRLKQLVKEHQAGIDKRIPGALSDTTNDDQLAGFGPGKAAPPRTGRK